MPALETIRFVHSADWQLGMWREQLSQEAQARFAAARIEAIRSIGEVARRVGASFAVVAGDVFESNLLDPAVVRRALDAMGEAEVPIYLLPGNHDPLQPGGIFKSPLFHSRCPANVHLLSDSEPRHPISGLELIGVPWLSRRPIGDPVGDLCQRLLPTSDRRLVVAHGAVDLGNPEPGNPNLIRVSLVEEAIQQRRLDYLALGDRHSTTSVGSTGAIWYSGTPEPTRFTEVDPGNVLEVELGDAGPEVTPHRVGTWTFVSQDFTINGRDDLERLSNWLEDRPAKERTLLRLAVRGTVSVQVAADLDARLEGARSLYAGVRLAGAGAGLAVLPDDSELLDLGLSGFAQVAADNLPARAGAGDEVAADALALLFRLVRDQA